MVCVAAVDDDGGVAQAGLVLEAAGLIPITDCYFSPSAVKIQRAKNIKLKSKVGTARGPVVHRRKQSSRILRPN